MKLALLGKGKTGGNVLELLRPEDQVLVFDSKNPVSLEKLKEIDVLIAFVDGSIFLPLVDTLVESKVLVISGVTGMQWPKDLNQRLIDNNITWVKSHNFALGMRLVHEVINILSKASDLFDDVHYGIHEVHHVHKKDAPSGTALSWKDWLGHESTITSDRTGDVVGDHELTIETPFERITLKHESLDRKIFASGALWCARKIIKNPIEPGLHHFEDYVRKNVLNTSDNP